MSMPDNIPLFNSYHGFLHNLALRSLAGNLDIDGVDVKILDLIFFQKSVRKIVKKAVREYRPSVVGLTAMTFQYDTARKVAALIKGIDKDIKIAIGGYHATLMYEEIAKSQEGKVFDFIIRGEGEFTFRELVGNLRRKDRGFDQIRGLSFRDEGRFIHNKPRELLNLNELKHPRRSNVDLFKINYGVFARPEVIETTRGCTYGCNFCSIQHMYGTSYRKFEIGRVIQDIKNAKESGAVRMMFADDNIALDPGNLKTLCDAIVENGLNDIWYGTQAHVKELANDEELVRKLSRANFNVIFLGIESPSARNLGGLNKTATNEEARRAVLNLRKHDIAVMGGFITAHPDDTKKDIGNVFEFSKELGCDILMMQILTPYPKTKIRDTLAESGMTINHTDYSKYNGFRCNVRTRHLSPGEIMWTVSVGNIKWYLSTIYNPNNWFNKSKRVLPGIRPQIHRMTWHMILQFILGRYGKSAHRF